jgi:hypothetical protein
MQDPDQFKEKIQLTMINVMAVLYDIGIRQVHTGAMMRLLGVTNDVAAEYDDSYIELDDRFPAMREQANTDADSTHAPPPGTIFH